MTQAAPGASAIPGRMAIAGIGETGYLRGSDQSVLQMVLAASMAAITDAGLTPADIDGILPPPGFVAWDEIAAHLGVRNVRYTTTPQMGGASPTAALLTAAMAISAGVATTILVPIGWNGYSALRPRPDARPSKRRFTAAFLENVRNFYAPYGLRSAPWWYALYLQRYVEQYGVPPEAAGAVALACRNHAQLNDKALMRGRPLTLDDYLEGRRAVRHRRRRTGRGTADRRRGPAPGPGRDPDRAAGTGGARGAHGRLLVPDRGVRRGAGPGSSGRGGGRCTAPAPDSSHRPGGSFRE